MKKYLLTLTAIFFIATIVLAQEDPVKETDKKEIQSKTQIQTTPDNKLKSIDIPEIRPVVTQPEVKRKTTPVATQEIKPEAPIDPKDLNAVYRQLKDKSETYNAYRVIKESRLDDFWKTVTSNVDDLKKEIRDQEVEIEQLNAEMESAKIAMAENVAQMEENEYAATHIQFLGIGFSKGAFKVMTFSIIGGLGVLLLLGYLQYNHNSIQAREKRALYEKVEAEYQEFRKRSLEKQIKIKRELQDYVNKFEDMKNTSSSRTLSKKISA